MDVDKFAFWPIDQDSTQLCLLLLLLYLYSVLFISKRLDFLCIPAYIFMILAIPLGHDSLNYFFLIESGEIGRFGPIWTVLLSLHQYIDWWPIFYILSWAIIVFSFYRLAKTSSYPSFAFVLLLTAPAVGLDYISILRQGLATGFLIISYTALLRAKIGMSYLLSGLAVSTHMTSLAVIPLLYKYLFSFRKYRLRFWILICIFFVSLFVALNFMPFIDERVQYYNENYIQVDDEAPVSGRFVLFYWLLVSATPILACIITDFSVEKIKRYNKNLYFMLVYFILWLVTPPLARLVWYILPFHLIHVLCQVRDFPLLAVRTYQLLIIGLATFLFATAWVITSPGHFWNSTYG